MRKWTRLEIVANSGAADNGVHGLNTLGQRPHRSRSLQRQGQVATEQRFDRFAETGPVFHLTGDGSPSHSPNRPGLENQIVTELHWLTHIDTVAFCHQQSRLSNPAHRRFRFASAGQEPAGAPLTVVSRGSKRTSSNQPFMTSRLPFPTSSCTIYFGASPAFV